MKVNEFFKAPSVDHQKSLAGELFDTGMRWTVIGVGTLAVGAVAEISGVKQGIDIMFAGYPVDCIGGALFAAAAFVGIFTGDDIES